MVAEAGPVGVVADGNGLNAGDFGGARNNKWGESPDPGARKRNGDRRQRNHPAVGRFFRASDAQRLGDEDTESFAGIVAEPAGVEVVVERRLEIALGAFGNDGDVGVEVIKRLALARERHSTIPDDDFSWEERTIGYHGSEEGEQTGNQD